MTTPRNPYSSGIWEPNRGCDYTAEEVEFIMAVEKAMRRKRLKFPTCRLVLEVARSLGYRKVTDDGPAGQ